MKLQVVEASPEFACGTYGPLAIAVWEAPATERSAMSAAQVLRMLGAGRDDVYMLAVLSTNTPPAGNEVRDIISAAVRDLGAKVRATATVVEGEGFRAAAMRAALLGMNMIMRRSHPQKSFGTLGEAVSYLSQQSDELREENLLRAVHQLRQR
jgi:hypothetical protein